MDVSRGVFTLLIEHTGGTLPEPEDLDESNISRMDHVVINSNDPDGLVDLYKEKYGIRLALDQFVEKWGGRMLFLGSTTPLLRLLELKKMDRQKILYGA